MCEFNTRLLYVCSMGQVGRSLMFILCGSLIVLKVLDYLDVNEFITVQLICPEFYNKARI